MSTYTETYKEKTQQLSVTVFYCSCNTRKD